MASLVCGLVLGCAPEGPARLPTRVPPEVTRTTDGPTTIQTSAFVEAHVWLVRLATTPELRAPEAAREAREAYAAVLTTTGSDDLARRTTRALGECGDLDCAKRALSPAGLDGAFARVFPWFVAQIWPVATGHVDLAARRLRAFLPETFPELSGALARALRARPPSTIRLEIVHEDPRYEGDPLLPLALEDTRTGMLSARDGGRATVAAALFQVATDLRDTSGVHAAFERALPADARGRRRAATLYALVAAHATRTLVARALPGDEAFTRGLLARAKEAEALLTRRWSELETTDFIHDLDAACPP
jgi:hypothetical protein